MKGGVLFKRTDDSEVGRVVMAMQYRWYCSIRDRSSSSKKKIGELSKKIHLTAASVSASRVCDTCVLLCRPTHPHRPLPRRPRHVPAQEFLGCRRDKPYSRRR